MMKKLLGDLRILLGLGAVFAVLACFTGDLTVAGAATVAIAAYVVFGGYISLLKDGAVRVSRAPSHEAVRLTAAADALIRDLDAAGVYLGRLRLYILPDDDLNAAAYGAGCIGVTAGTLNAADPVELSAVLAHEASHILSRDSEMNRLAFAAVTALIAAVSVFSFALGVVIFILFAVLGLFNSFLGVLAYEGTTGAKNGIFSMFERIIVALYKTLLGFIARFEEKRADRFAVQTGYGLQLAHFLALCSEDRPVRLSDVLYRSHPPLRQRIARIERMLSSGGSEVIPRF